MELAVLAAWINFRRQLIEQPRVDGDVLA